jgi:hypothetical protein
MKTHITFSYGIRNTNLLSHWNDCCKGYVILNLKGVKKILFLHLKVCYDDQEFLSLSLSLALSLSLYEKIKEVLFDLGFNGLGFHLRD